MKRSGFKIFPIALSGTLNTLFITIEIFLYSINLRWSPWYDPENGLGMALLLPIMLLIFLLLWVISFSLWEVRLNSMILFLSFATYWVGLHLIPYGHKLLNTFYIGNMVIHSVFLLLTLANTIWVIVKVTKNVAIS